MISAILVTGAAGAVGAAICHAILDAGGALADVINVARTRPGAAW
jgi:nucleoside-diphosphate-sugar epimerase